MGEEKMRIFWLTYPRVAESEDRLGLEPVHPLDGEVPVRRPRHPREVRLAAVPRQRLRRRHPLRPHRTVKVGEPQLHRRVSTIHLPIRNVVHIIRR